MSPRALPDTSARSEPTNLALLLREPFLTLTERLERRLADEGHPEVHAAHGNVFGFLDDAGTRVSELARRAQVTKQSMAQLVLHLERHDYVTREPDPGDGRAQLVRATRKGNAVFAIARELMVETEAGLAKQMGEADLRKLRRLLERLGEAL